MLPHGKRHPACYRLDAGTVARMSFWAKWGLLVFSPFYGLECPGDWARFVRTTKTETRMCQMWTVMALPGPYDQADRRLLALAPSHLL